MRRILIIGAGGSGKSTLSRRLGEKLGLEVLHLDRFYWGEGWVKPSESSWRRTIEELLARDTWVMDGNFSGTLAERVQACDTIVFLDLSAMLCIWRVLKRRLSYQYTSRPDMAEGCNEKLDLAFIGWILNYSRRTRPKVLKLIEENSCGKAIVWLRSRREIDQFVADLNIDVSPP